MKLTIENFKALSKHEDIKLFDTGYTLFLDAAEALAGDAGHLDDKHLRPTETQAALFNALHPSDLGVTGWSATPPAELVKILGMSYFSMKGGAPPVHQIWHSIDLMILALSLNLATLSLLLTPGNTGSCWTHHEST